MLDLERLKAVTDTVRFRVGDTIIQEGSTLPRSMYVVLEGEVYVYKDYKQEDESLLATLGTGEIFGEMALFLGKPRGATVIAKSPTRVAEITKENMNDVFKQFPELPHIMMKVLSSRLREGDEGGFARLPRLY